MSESLLDEYRLQLLALAWGVVIVWLALTVLSFTTDIAAAAVAADLLIGVVLVVAGLAYLQIFGLDSVVLAVAAVLFVVGGATTFYVALADGGYITGVESVRGVSDIAVIGGVLLYFFHRVTGA